MGTSVEIDLKIEAKNPVCVGNKRWDFGFS